MDALTLDRAGVHLGAHCEATPLGLHARTRLFWGHREEDGVEAPLCWGRGSGDSQGPARGSKGGRPALGLGPQGLFTPNFWTFSSISLFIHSLVHSFTRSVSPEGPRVPLGETPSLAWGPSSRRRT